MFAGDRLASSWLSWLARTHLEPRGIVVLGHPSPRVLDIELPTDDGDALNALKAAVKGGALAIETMPAPPARLLK